MISKGFNFPKLNCIVVVDADFSGRGYDLRATEKNIQLYNQLSGRAGRFSNNSLIIYQTITPTNETLKDILKNDPQKFLLNELSIRKKNKLPPFFSWRAGGWLQRGWGHCPGGGEAPWPMAVAGVAVGRCRWRGRPPCQPARGYGMSAACHVALYVKMSSVVAGSSRDSGVPAQAVG